MESAKIPSAGVLADSMQENNPDRSAPRWVKAPIMGFRIDAEAPGLRCSLRGATNSAQG